MVRGCRRHHLLAGNKRSTLFAASPWRRVCPVLSTGVYNARGRRSAVISSGKSACARPSGSWPPPRAIRPALHVASSPSKLSQGGLQFALRSLSFTHTLKHGSQPRVLGCSQACLPRYLNVPSRGSLGYVQGLSPLCPCSLSNVSLCSNSPSPTRGLNAPRQRFQLA